MEPMLTMALRAARKAGEIIERALERVDLLTIEEKGRNDFVSEIDKKAEQEILYHLKKAYPDHAFLGEERLGARIIDNVVVTATGAELLSRYSRELMVVD